MMECEEGGHLQLLDIDIYRSGKEYLDTVYRNPSQMDQYHIALSDHHPAQKLECPLNHHTQGIQQLGQSQLAHRTGSPQEYMRKEWLFLQPDSQSSLAQGKREGNS